MVEKELIASHNFPCRGYSLDTEGGKYVPIFSNENKVFVTQNVFKDGSTDVLCRYFERPDCRLPSLDKLMCPYHKA